jgi:hypothetical protein
MVGRGRQTRFGIQAPSLHSRGRGPAPLQPCSLPHLRPRPRPFLRRPLAPSPPRSYSTRTNPNCQKPPSSMETRALFQSPRSVRKGMRNSASRPSSAHTGTQSPLGSPLRSPASPLRPHTVGAPGLSLSLGDTTADPAKAHRSQVKRVLRRRPWSAIIPKSVPSQGHEGSEAVAPPEEELRAILSKMGRASIDKSANTAPVACSAYALVNNRRRRRAVRVCQAFVLSVPWALVKPVTCLRCQVFLSGPGRSRRASRREPPRTNHPIHFLCGFQQRFWTTGLTSGRVRRFLQQDARMSSAKGLPSNSKSLKPSSALAFQSPPSTSQAREWVRPLQVRVGVLLFMRGLRDALP